MRSAETIRANFQTEESLLYFVVSKDGGKIFWDLSYEYLTLLKEVSYILFVKMLIVQYV